VEHQNIKKKLIKHLDAVSAEKGRKELRFVKTNFKVLVDKTDQDLWNGMYDDLAETEFVPNGTQHSNQQNKYPQYFMLEDASKKWYIHKLRRGFSLRLKSELELEAASDSEDDGNGDDLNPNDGGKDKGHSSDGESPSIADAESAAIVLDEGNSPKAVHGLPPSAPSPTPPISPSPSLSDVDPNDKDSNSNIAENTNSKEPADDGKEESINAT